MAGMERTYYTERRQAMINDRIPQSYTEYWEVDAAWQRVRRDANRAMGLVPPGSVRERYRKDRDQATEALAELSRWRQMDLIPE